MRMYYFGCHREPGHYFFAPGMVKDHEAGGPMPFSTQEGEPIVPWGYHIDQALCPFGPQTEGLAKLNYKDGWTALAFWDRSVDSRPGSNSVFVLEGTHDFPTMLSHARDRFPEVIERLPFEVRPHG
jgi:hypothetical protein